MRRLATAAGVSAVLLVSGPAWACGGVISADGAAEVDAFTALLSHDGATEDLLTVLAYQAPMDGAGAEGFAWLMPLPAAPEIAKQDDAAIRAALEITAPPLREDHVPSAFPKICGCGGASTEAGGGPGGAQVLGRTVVDAFEFVTLGASGVGEVQDWMRESGFVFHDRQSPVVQSYLDQGWVLVAARVLPGQQPSASLTPIRFRFDSPEPVFPLAIAGADHAGPPVSMTLFVVTPYRPASATFREVTVRPDEDGVFSTAGDRLELRYSAPLGETQADEVGASVAVPTGAWLTRYQSTWRLGTLDRDLVLSKASTQAPLDYSALLEDYAHARKWAYVRRGLAVFVLTTPVVLLAAGFIALIGGWARGGFRRREGPGPAG